LALIAKRNSDFDTYYDIIEEIFYEDNSDPVILLQLAEHYLHKDEF
jgi:hypothetical protein